MSEATHIRLAPTHRRGKYRRKCPTCEVRTTFYSFFETWYGWTSTCIRCGDEWNRDGRRVSRSRVVGWRERNIAAARERWARGIDPSKEYKGIR